MQPVLLPPPMFPSNPGASRIPASNPDLNMDARDQPRVPPPSPAVEDAIREAAGIVIPLRPSAEGARSTRASRSRSATPSLAGTPRRSRYPPASILPNMCPCRPLSLATSSRRLLAAACMASYLCPMESRGRTCLGRKYTIFSRLFF